MLAYDFIRICDTCQICNFIPLKKLCEVDHELVCLFLGQGQTKFMGRANKKIAQLMFLFHVEQLREM